MINQDDEWDESKQWAKDQEAGVSHRIIDHRTRGAMYDLYWWLRDSGGRYAFVPNEEEE